MSKLSKDSVALVHQIITVDKFRLGEKISSLPNNALSEIDKAIDYVLKN
ncbi:type II toxin-antitoxin system PemK/MazF family toxin [uncultured Treponema sp.]